MQLFLKPVAHGIQVPGRLRVLCQPAGLSLLEEGRELAGLDLMELLFSGHDVHGQLLKVGQVQFIHLVQQSDILQKLDLMGFQHLADMVDVGLSLAVFRLHGADLIGRLLEDSQKSLFFLFIKAPQFLDYARQQISDFSQILGLDVFQGTL